jgi:hypothetical protein
MSQSSWTCTCTCTCSDGSRSDVYTIFRRKIVIVVDDRIVIRGRLTDHSDLNAASTIVTRQTAITMQRSESGPWTRLFRCSAPLTSMSVVSVDIDDPMAY